MRRIAYIFCLTFICLTKVFCVQEAVTTEHQAVIVPSDILLPIAVPQPDCSLQFEQPLIIKYLDGKGGEVFRIRNRGTKPIRFYTYAIWTSINTGNINQWESKDSDHTLLSGQTVSSSEGDESQQIKIVNLTDELKDKLKLHGPMKGLIMFMIVHIEFADGSVFDANPKFKELQDYIEKLDLRFADDSALDTKSKLQALQEFVQKL